MATTSFNPQSLIPAPATEKSGRFDVAPKAVDRKGPALGSTSGQPSSSKFEESLTQELPGKMQSMPKATSPQNPPPVEKNNDLKSPVLQNMAIPDEPASQSGTQPSVALDAAAVTTAIEGATPSLQVTPGSLNDILMAAPLNPVMSFLSGHLEQMEPREIPQVVLTNPFIHQALQQANIAGYMEQPQPLGELLANLSFSDDLLATIQKAGLNPNTPTTPRQIFEILGIDPKRVGTELTILQQNLPIDGLRPYMERAAALRSSTVAPMAAAPHKTATHPSIPSAPTQEDMRDIPIDPRLLAAGVATQTTSSAVSAAQPLAAAPQTSTKGPIAPLNAASHTSEIGGPVAMSSTTTSSLAAPASDSAVNLMAKTVTQDPFAAIRGDMTAVESVKFVEGTTSPKMTNLSEALDHLRLQQTSAPTAPTAPIISSEQATAVPMAMPAELTKMPTELMTMPAESMTMDQSTPLITNTTSPQASWESPVPVGMTPVPVNADSITGAPKPEAMPPLVQRHDIKIVEPELSPINSQGVMSTQITKTTGMTTESNGVMAMGLDVPASEVLPRDEQDFSEFSDDAQQQPTSDGAGILPFTTVTNQRVDPSSFVVSTPEVPAQDHQAAAHKIMEQATMMIKDGGGSMRLDLGTHELGHIDLAIDIKDNKLNIRIIAETEQAKHMITNELPKLRDALADQRLTLQNAEVGLRGQMGQQSSNGFFQGQSQNFQREQMAFAGGDTSPSARQLVRPNLPGLQQRYRANFAAGTGQIRVLV